MEIKGARRIIAGQSTEEAVYRLLWAFLLPLFNLAKWCSGEKWRLCNTPIPSVKGQTQPGACFEISH